MFRFSGKSSNICNVALERIRYLGKNFWFNHFLSRYISYYISFLCFCSFRPFPTAPCLNVDINWRQCISHARCCCMQRFNGAFHLSTFHFANDIVLLMYSISRFIFLFYESQSISCRVFKYS